MCFFDCGHNHRWEPREIFTGFPLPLVTWIAVALAKLMGDKLFIKPKFELPHIDYV